MSALLEKAARALCHSIGAKMAMRRSGGDLLTVAMMCGFSWEGDGAHMEKFVDANWEKFVEPVRAVLKVIREPDEAMVKAAEATGDHWYFDASWQAMLDSLLSTSPKRGSKP